MTAGGEAIDGWRVSWTFPDDQPIDQSWNVALDSDGADATADNVAWIGALPAGGSTTLTCAP